MTAAGRHLVVVGAGGHGREVLDVVAALAAAAEAVGDPPPYEVLGLVADDPPDAGVLARRGATFLGPVERLAELGADHVLAVGDPGARRRLEERVAAWGSAPAVLVHPRATLGADVELEPGVVVAAGAHLTTNVRLGRHVQVNVGAVVSHDVRVGAHATLSPGVLLNGAVTVGPGALLGSGAVVLPGRTVGEGAVVGAGAVVVRDVPPGVTAVGVPARW